MILLRLFADEVWHVVPNHKWRNAGFYGRGEFTMPCGSKGKYGGRTEVPLRSSWFNSHPEFEFCLDCLLMASTGSWPPDPPPGYWETAH